MRQGTARPKKMQSSRGKKLHRTPPLPSMEEIKCQLHHPRKEAESVPDEPCRNKLVISRDASRHFRGFASPQIVCRAQSLSPIRYILHGIIHANCILFPPAPPPPLSFPSIPISLKQGHVAGVYQICSDRALERLPWPPA